LAASSKSSSGIEIDGEKVGDMVGSELIDEVALGYSEGDVKGAAIRVYLSEYSSCLIELLLQTSHVAHTRQAWKVIAETFASLCNFMASEFICLKAGASFSDGTSHTFAVSYMNARVACMSVPIKKASKLNVKIVKIDIGCKSRHDILTPIGIP
jgi:hypothetical protein